MAKKTYTPENTALCESLINAILSNAPDGVNIKAAAVRRVAAVRWCVAR